MLVFPALRRRLRRSARHKPGDPTLLAAGAWLELLDGLSRLGLEVPQSATSTEVAESMAEHFGDISDLPPAPSGLLPTKPSTAPLALSASTMPRPPGSRRPGSTRPCSIRSVTARARALLRVGNAPRDQANEGADGTDPAGALVNWGKSVLRKYGRHRTPSSRFPGYSDVTEIASRPFRGGVPGGGARHIAARRGVGPGYDEQFGCGGKPFKEHLATLSRLGKHPNVVTLYRSFLHDRRPAGTGNGTMPRSYGQRAALRGPLAPADVVPAAIEVAGALETAHRSGFCTGT